jgi:thioredoxin 1
MKIMKTKITVIVLLSTLILVSCSGSKEDKKVVSDSTGQQDNTEKIVKNDVLPTNGNGKVVYLNTQDFIQFIFDFRNEKDWKMKSTTPCVIDFYADWCRPCKMVAPIMDELSAEYRGKIQFYKVNIDMEEELANAFNIQSIPNIMMCPLNGKPSNTPGAMSKSDYVRMINGKILNAK